MRVCLSVTTLDPALARRMEPRAAAPARRLQAIAELTRAGVPAGVLAAPMIPALNDAEMEKILEAASRAGAAGRLRAAAAAARIEADLRGNGCISISPTAPAMCWSWCGRRAAAR